MVLLFALLTSAPVYSKDVLSPEQRAWLSAHPVIRVAPDPNFHPVEFFNEQGVYQGIAADYLKLIEKKLSIQFQVVRLSSWNEVMESIQKRQVDMLSNAVETPARRGFLAFTLPYLKLPSVILCRGDSDINLDMNALAGMKVSVVKGYSYEEMIRRYYPAILLDPVKDIATGVKKTSLKTSDAFIGDLASASDALESEGITNLRVCGEAQPMNISSFAVRKDWPELAGILEKGLSLITLEERNAILNKWISLNSEVSGISYKTLKIFLILAGILTLFFLGVLGWNASLKRKVRQRTLELEQNEEEHRVTINLAPVAIGICNLHGKILFINQKFHETLGYTLEDIPDVLIWASKAYPDPDDGSRLLKIWEEEIEKCLAHPEKSSFMINARITCKNGQERDFQILSRVSSRRVIVIFNDLSEQKNLQDVLTRAKEKAEEASRAKSVFLSNMSHELRTPMNGALGMLDLLLETDLMAEQREYLDMLKLSLENLHSIIHSILHFARIEGGEEKPENIKFDFKIFIQEILSIYQKQSALRSIPLIYQEDAGLPLRVSGDAQKLRQILMNLLSNAFKFTRQGRIIFSAALQSETQNQVQVLFTIRDTGVGISESQKETIFEPFTQGDLSFSKSFQGQGLGLTIVSRLARILGGSLSFESIENQGTVFYFSIFLNKV